jgi:hypothetical protein
MGFLYFLEKDKKLIENCGAKLPADIVLTLILFFLPASNASTCTRIIKS